MAFLRRRSLWLKIAVLAGAVWVTVCFLLYTEDRTAPEVVQIPSGLAAAAPQMANGFVPSAMQAKKEIYNVHSRSKLNQVGLEQGACLESRLKSRLPDYSFIRVCVVEFATCFSSLFRRWCFGGSEGTGSGSPRRDGSPGHFAVKFDRRN